MGPYFGLLVPIVSVVAVFTFVTVAAWSDNRRKEREAFYREETFRKIIEAGSEAGERVLALMREQETTRARHRIEGQKLGGLISTAVGAGMMVFLYALVDEPGVYLVGLIPLLVGLVLVLYAFLMAPRT